MKVFSFVHHFDCYWCGVMWLGVLLWWKGLSKRMLLQCLLRMLKVRIQKYCAAFSLEAQPIPKLSNMHFRMGQNHSPHYLTHFINRAVCLKHLLGSVDKYFNSFLRRSRLKRRIYKYILK